MIPLSIQPLVETGWLADHLDDPKQAVSVGARLDRRVITYCGCGISASLGLFARYLAGYRNLALYNASWEEWGTAATRPTERA